MMTISERISRLDTVDQIKTSLFLGTDRTSIRQAIVASRKGGRVSVPAVDGGIVDKFPPGAFKEKGLTLKTGHTSVQHYMPALLNAIVEGKIDTTFLISDRMALEDAPKGEAHIVSGWKNKVQATLAHATPAAVLAERHRKMAEPGLADDR